MIASDFFSRALRDNKWKYQGNAMETNSSNSKENNNNVEVTE